MEGGGGTHTHTPHLTKIPTHVPFPPLEKIVSTIWRAEKKDKNSKQNKKHKQ